MNISQLQLSAWVTLTVSSS